MIFLLETELFESAVGHEFHILIDVISVQPQNSLWQHIFVVGDF